MKKTYSNPDIMVVKMSTLMQMLAGSNGTLSTEEKDKITGSDGFGGREGDLDDEF